MRSGTDFEMITNYKKIIESLEEQPAFCMDQQVPDSEIAMRLSNLKTEVKKEQPNQQNSCSLADMLIDNYVSNAVTLTEVNFQPIDEFSRPSFLTSEPDPFLPNMKDFSQTSTPISSVPSTPGMCSSMSSTLSNTVSQLPLQVMSPSLSSPVSFSSSPKTKTYVTGLAGSGGTVTTNSNFLLKDHFQEEVEYTDLDKAVSFYDDLDTVKASVQSDTKKSVQLQEEYENGTLEDAIYFIIQQDSNNLNIPFDPNMWTCEHARRWVGWVCQKNGQCDFTREMPVFHDGQTICSWKYEDFSFHFGPSGHYLFNELDLWKTANSCFPLQNKSPLAEPACQTMSTVQNGFTGDGNTFSLSPASSPALSPCSSSDSDSSNGILSQHMDVADEDSAFYQDVKISPKSDSSSSCKLFHKRVPGRGHKKSIALWQFLRRLLLSEQNYGCIRWIDRKTGIFKIEDSKKVAHLWGAEKNRPAMNYDKLSRSVRQYYKKGIIKKPEQSKRLLYQFCPEYL